MNRQLIFLTGHRKSGTTMFHSLFDGHPSLNIYPVDLTVLYAYFPHIISSDLSDEALLNRLDKVVFGTLEAKLEFHKLEVDLAKFRQLFRSNLSNEGLRNPGMIIESMLSSWVTFRGLDPAKPFVVKETSSDIYAQEISEWFPNTRFIQLVRDPRDNYAALKAGVSNYYSAMGETELTTLASLINRALIDMKMALNNPSILGESQYRVVRFEDLVVNTERTMTDIAKFLNIEPSDHLNTPTFMGVTTAGNSHEGKKMVRVSKQNIARWKKRISKEEAMIIEFAFEGVMEKFDYVAEFSPEESSRAFAEYYKWSNYHYYFHDPFAAKG
jgi:hypothetical protein